MYEKHLEAMGERNSYSKTDPDATFMRMKEDHMKNGQLKPGYNVQVGSENGFVTHYSLYPNPTDTKTLIPVLESFKADYGSYLENCVADKGYGSISNYQEMEQRDVAAYIKYSHWEQEKKKRSKKYRYRSWKFTYDQERNVMFCPEGNPLTKERVSRRKNYDGSYEQIWRFRCNDCQSCPVKPQCTKQQFRTVEFNPERHRLQQAARNRLKTEVGWELYRRRGSEIETVFGQVKGNWGFRRFTTRGKKMVNCEWGLNMLAYNIQKLTESPS